MLRKKILLGVGLIGLVVLIIATFSKEIGLCPAYDYSICQDISNQIAEILFPLIPIVLLSLITYWTRDSVYQAWFRFARWWVPLSMLLILITPEYGGGLFNPIEKGSVAFVSSAFFFLISLVIIAWKYFSTRPN